MTLSGNFRFHKARDVRFDAITPASKRRLHHLRSRVIKLDRELVAVHYLHRARPEFEMHHASPLSKGAAAVHFDRIRPSMMIGVAAAIPMTA